MKFIIIFVGFLSFHFSRAVLVDEGETQIVEESPRLGKVFKIVTIPPTICMSDTDVGVCKSAASCTKLNGTRLGTKNCGTYDIGICCLPMFTPSVNEVPITIREKVSLILGNTNFDTNDFSFPRMNGSCQLKVEFKSFTYKAPTPQGMCMDYFSVTGSITVRSLKLCGPITRPLYLSYGNSEAIKFKFHSEDRSKFEVKVQHIDCNSIEKVDDHCLMNNNGETGRVESFGYGVGMGYQIAGLEYNVCVGGKSTKPLLKWEQCVDDNGDPLLPGRTNSFYTTHFFGNLGGRDQACAGKTSYVSIPGVGTYCGGYFAPVLSAPSNILMVKTVIDDRKRYDHVPPLDYIPVVINSMIPPTPVPACATWADSIRTEFTTCVVGIAGIVHKCDCTSLKPDPPLPANYARPALTGFCLQYSPVEPMS